MSEIDRQLDAAWRAASREQPPSALDASIRAAARRAVAATPGKAKTASWWRVKTHWAPFAAAAAVTVIAVGILQLTPPEQVTPGLIADRSVSTRSAELDSHKPSAPLASTTAEPRRDSASAGDELARERAAESARARLERAPAPMQSPSNAALEKKQRVVEAGAAVPAERQVAAAPEQARSMRPETGPGETTAAARGEPLPTAMPERAQSAKLKKDEAESPPKLARSEPFPAAAPPTSSGAREAARTPPPAASKEALPAASGPIASTSPSTLPAPKRAASPAEPQDKVAANVLGPASAPEVPQPQASGALASRTDPTPSSRTMGAAPMASADQARAKDAAAPRPADEWIKLIRRLRAEGKTDEATKELAAFRAAYKERADELLPVDLREPKP